MLLFLFIFHVTFKITRGTKPADANGEESKCRNAAKDRNQITRIKCAYPMDWHK
ncbi:hypothetical protein M758_2G174300 [Ceratodon purpureus]|nr:hypothetical protein M758_2G174300 [Ceratodon purpureus]